MKKLFQAVKTLLTSSVHIDMSMLVFSWKCFFIISIQTHILTCCEILIQQTANITISKNINEKKERIWGFSSARLNMLLPKQKKSIMPLCSFKNKNWFFIIGIFLFDLIYYSYLWMTVCILCLWCYFFLLSMLPTSILFCAKSKLHYLVRIFSCTNVHVDLRERLSSFNKQKHQVREFILFFDKISGENIGNVDRENWFGLFFEISISSAYLILNTIVLVNNRKSDIGLFYTQDE